MRIHVEALKRIYFQENDKDYNTIVGKLDIDDISDHRVTIDKLNEMIASSKITEEEKDYIIMGVIPKSEWYPEYLREISSQVENDPKDSDSEGGGSVDE